VVEYRVVHNVLFKLRHETGNKLFRGMLLVVSCALAEVNGAPIRHARGKRMEVLISDMIVPLFFSGSWV